MSPISPIGDILPVLAASWGSGDVEPLVADFYAGAAGDAVTTTGFALPGHTAEWIRDRAVPGVAVADPQFVALQAELEVRLRDAAGRVRDDDELIDVLARLRDRAPADEPGAGDLDDVAGREAEREGPADGRTRGRRLLDRHDGHGLGGRQAVLVELEDVREATGDGRRRRAFGDAVGDDRRVRRARIRQLRR